MNLLIEAAVKEARTRSWNAGLSLVLEQEMRARTDSKRMYLQRPQPHWSKDQWDFWWYTYEHELGHNDVDMVDVFSTLKSNKIGPGFVSHIMNQLDDHRQEHHNNDQYLGRKQRLNNGRKLFYDQYPPQVGNPLDEEGNPKDPHRLAAECLFVWDAIERQDWQPGVIGYGQKWATMLDAQQQEWLDKLSSGNYGSTLKSGLSGDELLELTKRIIDEVFNFDSQEEMQNAKENFQSAKGNGGKGKGTKGETGTEESEADSDQDGRGDGAGKTKQGTAGGKEEVQGRPTNVIVDYSDLLAHDHEQPHGDSYCDMTINYQQGSEAFISNLADGIELYDMDVHNVDMSHWRCEEHLDEINNINEGNNIADKLRKMLQARAAIRYQHGMKQGKISTKSLYRTKLQGSDMQQRVFRKKVENDVLNAAVTLLVDSSGSMSHMKYPHAVKAASLLNDGIGVLRVPVEIINFSDNNAKVRHALIKKFDKHLSSDQIIDRMVGASTFLMHSNSDGESIVWAYERLALRKEKKKVLIVISDGQPATDYNKGDAEWFTRQVIKNIEKEGVVDIVAIGMMDEHVKEMYTKYSIIDDASKLESALLEIIEKRIL